MTGDDFRLGMFVLIRGPYGVKATPVAVERGACWRQEWRLEWAVQRSPSNCEPAYVPAGRIDPAARKALTAEAQRLGGFTAADIHRPRPAPDDR